MAKKSKLFAALDAHQGKDHKLEKEKKKAKKAEREKRHKQHKKQEEEGVDEDDDEEGGIELNGVAAGNVVAGPDDNESEDESIMLDAAELDDSNTSGSEQDEEDDIEVEVEEAASDEDGDSDDDSIALSDLSAEQEDILPHQRLTIDNHAALLSSLHRIALPLATLSFTEHQSITSSERTAASIPAVDDDLARELAFYKQSLDAAVEARAKLIKDSVPFSRPADYFAEMVKTDEHMGKVKQKLVDAAAGKKAAAEARKQRDLKKFGKQVQVAKLQERDKAKRETLDKIQLLKRSMLNSHFEVPGG
ncbi:MAG: putative rRNA-processing protein EBP2 [Chaenotheca gracillima]|nr:MAG: putative rRNA-processing protein EBP2 [Chaenotheca gracillima]